MAEPIGIASGLVALSAFAFNSSVSLYQVIGSFQNNKKVIRELKEELQALDGVLRSLQEAMSNNTTDLSSLKLPLLRCGQACKDFEAVIAKCSTRSGGPKTSFLDWAKLKYMGDDITGFKNMLAGYKSTIIIALGDANLRSSTVTSEVLKQYQELITNTTSDLEEHLQQIDDRLQALSSRGALISDEDAADRERIQQEKDSTQQCLAICTQVLKQVDQLRPNLFENVTTADNLHEVRVATLEGLPSARRVTADVLQQFQETLVSTTSDFEVRLQAIDRRLQTLPSAAPTMMAEDAAEKIKIQEETDTVKQCLAICAQAFEQARQARTNEFEDILAAQGSHQLIVSTLGDLISAKRVTAERGAGQWLGQMTDASLQQLSRDRVELNGRSGSDKVESHSGLRANFTDQYGTGYKLNPCPA